MLATLIAVGNSTEGVSARLPGTPVVVKSGWSARLVCAIAAGEPAASAAASAMAAILSLVFMAGCPTW